MTNLALTVVSDCWNTIGVRGDRSCEQLTVARHCHHCPTFAKAAEALLERPAPDSYVQEMTEHLAKNPAERDPFTLSVVLFELAEQTFAIDTKAVVEVTELRPVHRVGHRTGAIFSGLVNIHGQLELCASLAGLLRLADSARPSGRQQAQARMVLIEHSAKRWVFPVDAVHGVHRFSASDTSDIPATLLGDDCYLGRVLSWSERRVGYLDSDKTVQGLEGSLR